MITHDEIHPLVRPLAEGRSTRNHGRSNRGGIGSWAQSMRTGADWPLPETEWRKTLSLRLGAADVGRARAPPD